MMLLISTSAPVRRFRFGLHRHKYATSFAPANALAKLRDPEPPIEGGESVDGDAAEALSNRWRFFTTYLATRFSPVLRHPFLVNP
jgi:hypothetical protein